jgi:hypothetical protein
MFFEPIRRPSGRSSLVILACLLAAVTGVCRADSGARDAIQKFYEKRLSFHWDGASDARPPELAFSKAFQSELKTNADICAGFEDEVCGFGADGDIYLDAQDFDDNLTPQKAGLQVRELKDGSIEARFKLFPVSAPQDLRIVRYRMVDEGGAWVVDDMIYADGRTARGMMQEENQANLKYLAEQQRSNPPGAR